MKNHHSTSTSSRLAAAALFAALLLAACAHPLAFDYPTASISLGSRAGDLMDMVIAYKVASDSEIQATLDMLENESTVQSPRVNWSPNSGWMGSSETYYPNGFFFEEGTYYDTKFLLEEGTVSSFEVLLPIVPVGQEIQLLFHIYNASDDGDADFTDNLDYTEWTGPTTYNFPDYGFPELPDALIDFAQDNTIELSHSGALLIGYTEPFSIVPGQTVDLALKYFEAEVQGAAKQVPSINYTITWTTPQ